MNPYLLIGAAAAADLALFLYVRREHRHEQAQREAEDAAMQQALTPIESEKVRRFKSRLELAQERWRETA